MSALPSLDRSLLQSGLFAGGAEARLADLPEKAVQFGTGAFLRGFVDYFIDQSNRCGQFNGRVVAIGSTGSGRDSRLRDQDCLYTMAIQGIDQGKATQEYRLITALSRVLSAPQEWAAVLECARNPDLELIFSNTTEVGIRLEADDSFDAAPPVSFPAKLTRFLYERAQAFAYAHARGLVVLPCELIEQNGTQLKALVLEQAARWQLPAQFNAWLEEAVPFCNTLVDRIVPGEADEAAKSAAAQKLGYRDDMLTVCEPYRLFAIEADHSTRARLRFAAADAGVVLTDDVTPYRQRKVRLLNGTHSIMVPLALLSGCVTVAEAVADETIGPFVTQVLLSELVPSMGAPEPTEFAHDVLARFANPYLDHALADITLQQTMKLRVRIVPAILDYARRFSAPPRAVAFGFAAYLAYLREEIENTRADDLAAAVRAIWEQGADDPHLVTDAACGLTEVWGTDLNILPGFATEVATGLEAILRYGARAALDAHLSSSSASR